MQTKRVVRFTSEEARNKLGQHVRSTTEFAGVPKGTSGTVVDIHRFGDDSFDVFVEWDLPVNRKLRDRFAKGPYEEFLLEINGLAVAV